MNIEKGSVVQKTDDKQMWGTVTQIYLGSGQLDVKAHEDSFAATGIATFTVHVSMVEPHVG